MEPAFDARLTWPEADRLRALRGCAVALRAPAGASSQHGAMELALDGGPAPVRLVPFEVPTPHEGASWLDVERPRVEATPFAGDDGPAGAPVALGKVREIAVHTAAVWWTPPERARETLAGRIRMRRGVRALQRRARPDERAELDELVRSWQRTGREPLQTLVDEGIELVADRVLRVWTVGFRLYWALDGEFEEDGCERHVLAAAP
jgi:hypothetical protein